MPFRNAGWRAVARAVMLAAVVSAAACSGTATSTSPIFVTDFVTGTVVTQVADVEPVKITVASTVQLVLVSLVPNTGVAVGVGIGVPPADGSAGCTLDAAEALAVGQSFTVAEDAGAHCIVVFEAIVNGAGAIPDPLTYTVKFNHH